MIFKKSVFFLLIIYSFQLAANTEGNKHPAQVIMEPNLPWTGLMRIKALESLDKMLALAFDQKYRSYKLHYPLNEEHIKNPVLELISFARAFGFFSPDRVLVGSVTEEMEDIQLTCDLLKAVHLQIPSSIDKTIVTGEILSKILAYRELKKEMEIPISVINKKGSSKLITYVIDRIFDLWHGMPAFGMIPKDKGTAPPILLFRGTDLSLGTTRSWASVISDLNTSGPGLSTFRNAQIEIHEWLTKAASYGMKTRVMGYSLGGVLTAYTAVYEYDLLNHDKDHPSLSFNPPGVSKAIWELWDEMPRDTQVPLQVYVVRGDLVSKIGLLFGDVVEFSLDNHLKPISAHVTLISGQPSYHLFKVNVAEENLSR